MEVRQGIDESFSTCLKSESESCSAAAAAKSRQSCPTLCDPIGSVVSNSVTPWGYTVYGILQDRIVEWVAFPFSRGSSQPRDPTQVSCIAGRFFTVRATRGVPCGQPLPENFLENSCGPGGLLCISRFTLRPETQWSLPPPQAPSLPHSHQPGPAPPK